MTERSRRLVLFSAVTDLVMLAVAGWLLWPHTAITRASAQRIEVGLTLAEVQAILGGSAPDETDEYRSACAMDLKLRRLGNDVTIATHRWIGPDRKVEVAINAKRRVISVWSGYPPDLALSDRLCTWLRLLVQAMRTRPALEHGPYVTLACQSIENPLSPSPVRDPPPQ